MQSLNIYILCDILFLIFYCKRFSRSTEDNFNLSAIYFVIAFITNSIVSNQLIQSNEIFNNLIILSRACFVISFVCDPIVVSLDCIFGCVIYFLIFNLAGLGLSFYDTFLVR